MGKKDYGKFKKKEKPLSNKKKYNSDDDDMLNDEIDAFHKERDIIPIDVNDDTEDSDEDAEQPVFDLQDEDDDEDEVEEKEEEDDKPVKLDRGMAAKIIRTQKFLRSKFGDLDDETLDDAEEEEEEKPIWGRKEDLYGGNEDYESGSGDELDPAEAEEAEVLRLQTERAKFLVPKDYGIDDDDTELTFEEILDGRKPPVNGSLDKVTKEDTETVMKDLSTLTKEEQMNIVYSSAPELVGLLSELNDALSELENKVNPLLDTIRERESSKKGGVMNYLEVKQLLLQSFCQAITFYLLLKSEGNPVRDHPVVSRLVEIKSLVDKMKEMDGNLPFDFEDIIRKDAGDVAVTTLVEKKAADTSDSLANGQIVSKVSSEDLSVVEPNEAADGLRKSKKSKLQDKPQDTQAGVQSMEMMKVRAGLEEKLKQTGVYRSIPSKNVRVRENSHPVNRQLETLADFDDEAMGIDGVQNGGSNIVRQLTSQSRKRKVISGDADIPVRDDLGERRRKYELRVLAGAGINSFDGTEDDDNVDSVGDEDQSDSDSDDFYEQVEQKHAAKLAAKANKYSRTPEVQYLEETTADGKRHISNQIEKNRGLTRTRNKDKKNPRKNYRLKNDKQEKRRRGQVRDVLKPTRPYAGEASGINTNISRSVRF